MTIDELLCKLQGKCWHLWEYDWRGLQICSKCGIDRIYSSIKNNYVNDNLDFSDDRVAMELLRWFSLNRLDMFIEFYDYMDIVAEDFILLKEADGKQYVSWVVLLSEWLRLEETREKWGWEECPTCWRPGDYTGPLPMFCPRCNGSGKIRAEWAREEG